MPKTDMHEFKSDPQSGAGNCVCGAAERHRRHFHKFVPAMIDTSTCTCGLPENATHHIEMIWVNDDQVMSKSVFDTMKVMNK